jgi:hypothetical protein
LRKQTQTRDCNDLLFAQCLQNAVWPLRKSRVHEQNRCFSLQSATSLYCGHVGNEDARIYSRNNSSSISAGVRRGTITSSFCRQRRLQRETWTGVVVMSNGVTASPDAETQARSVI